MLTVVPVPRRGVAYEAFVDEDGAARRLHPEMAGGRSIDCARRRSAVLPNSYPLEEGGRV
jgi:hypothetical protein